MNKVASGKEYPCSSSLSGAFFAFFINLLVKKITKILQKAKFCGIIILTM
ncbi:hypothetical protein HMPREF9386_1736 [Streptococcus sanguinis SK330]|uniref:Uncharacterized protein n=1 Tax=Streptococcus sanguinis SK330 TaxID=888813 RepID=F2C953_STRSA|nr:hypothetical protein HMPREF9386_1736 [Streptococcus sanguinis SK330]